MKKESNEIVTALRGLVEKNNESYSESVGTAIDKTLGAAGEIADTAIKLPAKAVGYVKGLKKGLKKAAKKGENKANESYEADEILCNLVESGKFTMEEGANIVGIEIDEAQTAYEKARKAAARRAADRNAARRRGEMGGRMERETYTNEAGKEMHYKGYSA